MVLCPCMSFFFLPSFHTFTKPFCRLHPSLTYPLHPPPSRIPSRVISFHHHLSALLTVFCHRLRSPLSLSCPLRGGPWYRTSTALVSVDLMSTRPSLSLHLSMSVLTPARVRVRTVDVDVVALQAASGSAALVWAPPAPCLRDSPSRRCVRARADRRSLWSERCCCVRPPSASLCLRYAVPCEHALAS